MDYDVDAVGKELGFEVFRPQGFSGLRQGVEVCGFVHVAKVCRERVSGGCEGEGRIECGSRGLGVRLGCGE